MDFPQQAELYRTKIKGMVLIDTSKSFNSRTERLLPFGVLVEGNTMYVQYVPNDWDGLNQHEVHWMDVKGTLHSYTKGTHRYIRLEPLTKDDENKIRELK